MSEAAKPRLSMCPKCHRKGVSKVIDTYSQYYSCLYCGLSQEMSPIALGFGDEQDDDGLLAFLQSCNVTELRRHLSADISQTQG